MLINTSNELKINERRNSLKLIRYRERIENYTVYKAAIVKTYFYDFTHLFEKKNEIRANEYIGLAILYAIDVTRNQDIPYR